MKKRNLIVTGLLSLTGIYILYWLYSSGKDLAIKSGRKMPGIAWVIVPVIAGLLLGGLFGSLIDSDSLQINFDAGDKSLSVQDQEDIADINEVLEGAGGVVAGMFGGLMIAGAFSLLFLGYYAWKYAKALAAYSGNEMSFPVNMLLLLSLMPFGILIIQDYFNNKDELKSSVKAAKRLN